MNALNQEFTRVFDPIMKEKGFKRRGIVYHRLVNNKIIQIFSTRKFSTDFTLQYCIMPVCSGEVIEFPLDENRIGDLLGHESLIGWDLEDDIETSIADALDKCKKYLLCWFDYVNDYKTYYEFAIKRHEIEIQFLRGKIKIPKREEYLYKVPRAVGFYETSLCVGEFESALAYVNKYYRQNTEAAEHNRLYGIEPTKEKIERIEKLKQKIEMTIEFQNGNLSYAALIEENEKKSIEGYYKTFKIKIE